MLTLTLPLTLSHFVIPAKAGIHGLKRPKALHPKTINVDNSPPYTHPHSH